MKIVLMRIKLFMKVFIYIVFTTFICSQLHARSVEDRLRIVQADESDLTPDQLRQQQNPQADVPTEVNEPQPRREIQEVELPPPAPEDKVILEAGINYYNSGNMDTALVKFNELSNDFPMSPYNDQAYLYKARIHNRRGDVRTAMQELSNIRNDSGEYPAALFLAGEILYTDRNYTAAKEYFFRVSSMFPGSMFADQSLIYLSRTYMNLGEGERALEAVVTLIRNYPNRNTVAEAYFLMGQIFMTDPELRDLERARLAYKRFLHKAEVEKDPIFAESGLLGRVRSDYQKLNSFYFNE